MFFVGERLSTLKSFKVKVGSKGLNYSVTAVKTKFWRPGDDYIAIIMKSVSTICSEGDFIVISEKALSVAKNRLLDEQFVKPGFLAKVLAKVWMRLIWGCSLGKICHMSRTTRRRLRFYPLKEGSAHKQVCLRHVGLLQSLRHGSEGGIDAGNLPYLYVCLPLEDPERESERIRAFLLKERGLDVNVMIVDTDKTYLLGGTNYTPLPQAIPGVKSGGGIITYLLGRIIKSKRRATPVGYSGKSLALDLLLDVAELSNRARGVGAGRSPWHMAERFKVGIGDVTWEMLESVRHYPIVIVRSLD